MIGKQMILMIGILIISSAFVGIIDAQEGRGKGRLRGEIVDSAGKPISDATITLEYQTYERILETRSTGDGVWTFVGLGSGPVIIKATKKGYVPGGIHLHIHGINPNPRQKIVLKQQDEVETETKTVEDSEKKADLKRANDLFNRKKFSEALTLYRKFVKLKPKKHEIKIYVAHCLLGMKQYAEAIAAYRTCLKLLTGDNGSMKRRESLAAVYAGIAEAYLSQNQLAEAMTYFKQSIEVNPGDHILTYNVAEILFYSGKIDDAIRYYRMTIQNNPDFPNAYKRLGYSYLNRGEIKNAVNYLKKYLEMSPDAPDAPEIREIVRSLK